MFNMYSRNTRNQLNFETIEISSPDKSNAKTRHIAQYSHSLVTEYFEQNFKEKQDEITLSDKTVKTSDYNKIFIATTI